MAEKKVYTLGLASVKMGAIAQDGGMGSSLAALGYTYKDSCTLTCEDPETNDFYAEEVDDPVVSISKAGKTTLEFSLMNPSPEQLVILMGGTASASSGSGDNDTWEAPDSMPSIEKSVEITPKQGYKIEIPRMKIEAKLDGNIGQSDLFMVKVKGTILQPTKSGEKKMKLTQLAAS